MGFLLVTGAGYAAGLVYVHRTTGMRPEGVAERFRGNEEAGAVDPERSMTFAPSPSELLETTHNHLLGIGTYLVILGAIFAGSTLPARMRAIVVAVSFAALAVDFASIWLVRWAGEAFAVLTWTAGAALTAAVAVEALASLADLARPRADLARPRADLARPREDRSVRRESGHPNPPEASGREPRARTQGVEGA